jgi:hypothetical protein
MEPQIHDVRTSRLQPRRLALDGDHMVDQRNTCRLLGNRTGREALAQDAIGAIAGTTRRSRISAGAVAVLTPGVLVGTLANARFSAVIAGIW